MAWSYRLNPHWSLQLIRCIYEATFNLAPSESLDASLPEFQFALEADFFEASLLQSFPLLIPWSPSWHSPRARAGGALGANLDGPITNSPQDQAKAEIKLLIFND